MIWLVHNCGEAKAPGWLREVEADTAEEAIKKSPPDWGGSYWGYGAVLKSSLSQEELSHLEIDK
ncbi:MAG: hypothetical protein KGI38_11920 [Thaumarchaeota archaeon]|nr:hypothetical protein [Nitrososphaerota archaeon]